MANPICFIGQSGVARGCHRQWRIQSPITFASLSNMVSLTAAIDDGESNPITCASLSNKVSLAAAIDDGKSNLQSHLLHCPTWCRSRLPSTMANLIQSHLLHCPTWCRLRLPSMMANPIQSHLLHDLSNSCHRRWRIQFGSLSSIYDPFRSASLLLQICFIGSHVHLCSGLVL